MQLFSLLCLLKSLYDAVTLPITTVMFLSNMYFYILGKQYFASSLFIMIYIFHTKDTVLNYLSPPNVYFLSLISFSSSLKKPLHCPLLSVYDLYKVEFLFSIYVVICPVIPLGVSNLN